MGKAAERRVTAGAFSGVIVALAGHPTLALFAALATVPLLALVSWPDPVPRPAEVPAPGADGLGTDGLGADGLGADAADRGGIVHRPA